MRRFIDNHQVPGILTVIAKNGKVVHKEAQGYADIENKKELTTETIFRLFSMTKPVTGVAVMILYEEGFFFLDDPIQNYLPEFTNQKVYTEHGLVDSVRPITIRHLLTHTAGFTYPGLHTDPAMAEIYDTADGGEGFARLSDFNLKEHVKKLAALPLVCQPGTQWSYGEAMSVLARLVEVVSGQKYSEFLRERIFIPLEMNSTGYFVSEDLADNLAVLYEQCEGKLQPSEIGGDYTIEPHLEAGGAGLAGSAADYLRFAQMLLNGGELDGTRLLSPTTVKLMMSDHLSEKLGDNPVSSLEFPVARGDGLGFGFCGTVVRRASACIAPGSDGEYSWAGYANTDFWIDPEKALIGLVFTQVLPHEYHLETRARMRQMTYQAITEHH